MGIDSIKNIFQSLTDFWTNLSKANKVKLVAGIVLAIAAIIAAFYFFTKRDFVPLVNVTDPIEATNLKNYLTEAGEPYKVQGNTIYVDKNRADQLWFELFAARANQGGTANYDLITKNNSFGTTESDKSRLWIITLQERIQEGLKGLDLIESAHVNLTIPDNSSFTIKRDKKEPTASVILKLRPNVDLNPINIKAVENYVATSVEGLKPENVSITDSNMRPLNRTGQNTPGELASDQLDVEKRITEELTSKVQNILDPMYGAGNYRVVPDVRVDLRKQSSTSETFTPPLDQSGIVRTQEQFAEAQTGTNAAAGAGLDPNAVAPQYPAGTGTESYESTRNISNYEINRLVEELEAGPMTISALNIAVVVDSNLANIQLPVANPTTAGAPQAAANANQPQTAPLQYANNPQDLAVLLAAAAGIPPENVTVQFQAFAGNMLNANEMELARQAEEAKQRQAFIMQAVIYGFIALFLVLVAILVYRALTARTRLEAEALAMAQADLSNPMILDDSSAFDDLLGIEREPNPLDDEPEQDTTRNIIEFVMKDPEAAAQLLKVWLYEEDD